MNHLHDAAFRAGLWQVIEARARELKDAAKSELSELEVGDTVAGSVDGQVIAKATKTRGRAKLVVTDEKKLLEWLEKNAPSEIHRAVNPAYLSQLEFRARAVGAPIDHDGEIIPGLELVEGEPYVSVRRQPAALFWVSQLFNSGRLSLDEIKEIDA